MADAGTGMRIGIWLCVYITLLLLVYIGYGAGIAANDFPNKDGRAGAIWTMFTFSIITFIMTAGFHIAEWKVTAAVMLMLSIFFDSILSVLIGTTNMQGDYSAALGYVSISPIVYKLTLFLFLNWDACGGDLEGKIGTASGSLRERIQAMKAKRAAAKLE